MPIDSIQILNSANAKIDSLAKIITSASQTISDQNQMLSSYSTFFTFLGIILALIGLIVPAAGYFITIAPAQKVMNKFEEEVDKRFENYLNKKDRADIDKAITKLKSKSSLDTDSAKRFLGFSDNLIDKDYNEIYNLIKHGKPNSIMDKLDWLNLLTNKKNMYADLLAHEKLLTGQVNAMEQEVIFGYYGKVGYKDKCELIADYILSDHNGTPNKKIYSFLSRVMRENIDSFFELLNSYWLCNLVDRSTSDYNVCIHMIKTTVNDYNLSDDAERSMFYTKNAHAWNIP